MTDHLVEEALTMDGSYRALSSEGVGILSREIPQKSFNDFCRISVPIPKASLNDEANLKSKSYRECRIAATVLVNGSI